MPSILAALSRYGATLTPDGRIQRGEKVTSVRAVIAGRRLRMESASTGALLFSGPVAESAVDAFVRGFWFWTPAA